MAGGAIFQPCAFLIAPRHHQPNWNVSLPGNGALLHVWACMWRKLPKEGKLNSASSNFREPARRHDFGYGGQNTHGTARTRRNPCFDQANICTRALGARFDQWWLLYEYQAEGCIYCSKELWPTASGNDCVTAVCSCSVSLHPVRYCGGEVVDSFTHPRRILPYRLGGYVSMLGRSSNRPLSKPSPDLFTVSDIPGRPWKGSQVAFRHRG